MRLHTLCTSVRPLVRPCALPWITSTRRSHMRTTRMALHTPGNGAFPSLVSPEWLLERRGQVKILDANWYMPNQGKDAVAEFRAERVPGAAFFDLDGVCDKSTDLPHMLPSEAQFAAAADALGVSNDDAVVIYDHSGIFSAPRAWWTWRVLGHERVAVLDGGLPAWKAAGGAVDTSPVAEEELRTGAAAAQAPPGETKPRYAARLRRGEVRGWREVLANVESGAELVVDARPGPRWRGEAPEPRPGLAMGHIPGSVNVPWSSVVEEGRMKPAEVLRAAFAAAGVDPSSRVVASCGSGTTACILVLALEQLHPGAAPPAVYDGSWSEWGALPGVPVEQSS